jgi:hypothetical protein
MAREVRVLTLVCMIVAFAAVSVFAQVAGPDIEAAKDPAPAPAAASIDAQPKEIAVYGEVQAVNSALGTFSVQYYDYDSDSEKTSEIVAGAATKMENVKAVGEIKKGDWVDVTFTVSDGKNMAKTVSVEKEEPAGDTADDLPSE